MKGFKTAIDVFNCQCLILNVKFFQHVFTLVKRFILGTVIENLKIAILSTKEYIIVWY